MLISFSCCTGQTLGRSQGLLKRNLVSGNPKEHVGTDKSLTKRVTKCSEKGQIPGGNRPNSTHKVKQQKQSLRKPKEPQTALQEQAGTPKEAQRTPKNPDGQIENPTKTNNYHCSRCCAPPLAGMMQWGSAERQRM